MKMSIPVLNFSTELAHLVSRFACNTMMIVDASSSPPVSHVKKLQQNLKSIQQASKQKINITSLINQILIHKVVNLIE